MRIDPRNHVVGQGSGSDKDRFPIHGDAPSKPTTHTTWMFQTPTDTKIKLVEMLQEYPVLGKTSRLINVRAGLARIDGYRAALAVRARRTIALQIGGSRQQQRLADTWWLAGA